MKILARFFGEVEHKTVNVETLYTEIDYIV